MFDKVMQNVSRQSTTAPAAPTYDKRPMAPALPTRQEPAPIMQKRMPFGQPNPLAGASRQPAMAAPAQGAPVGQRQPMGGLEAELMKRKLQQGAAFGQAKQAMMGAPIGTPAAMRPRPMPQGNAYGLMDKLAQGATGILPTDRFRGQTGPILAKDDGTPVPPAPMSDAFSRLAPQMSELMGRIRTMGPRRRFPVAMQEMRSKSDFGMI